MDMIKKKTICVQITNNRHTLVYKNVVIYILHIQISNEMHCNAK